MGICNNILMNALAPRPFDVLWLLTIVANPLVFATGITREAVDRI